jgi:metal-responsive CopG/Arc/MetJ family transcriptional regulator
MYTLYTPMQAIARKPVILPVRIPAELAAKLDAAVSRLHYASKNEFVREAIDQHVNEKLKGRIIEVRDVSVKEAARMIDRHLSKNPGVHYVSELSEELGLELGVAFRAAAMLREKGSVKVRS